MIFYIEVQAGSRQLLWIVNIYKLLHIANSGIKPQIFITGLQTKKITRSSSADILILQKKRLITGIETTTRHHTT